MKLLRLAFFVATLVVGTSISAQTFTPACGVPPPPGATSCEATCVYCDFNGITGRTSSVPTGGNTICGQIEVQNDEWFGFIAATNHIGFTIYTSNCETGDGLQAAILESCTEDVLSCNPGFSSGANIPLEVSYDDFKPGFTYYLMIDGWLGEVCDYEIQVTSGNTVPLVPDPVAQITGPNRVCPGATMTYSVPKVDFASYLRWTAPPGASINGMGNNVITEAGALNEVTITFGNVGGQVCVSAGNSCTPLGVASCLAVLNQPIPPTILPPLTIAFTELPYFWDEGGVEITEDGFFQLQATLQSWLGCDSLVRQLVTVLPPNGIIKGTVFWDTNNNGVKDSGEPPFGGGAVIQSSSGALTNSDMVDGKFTFNNQNIGDTIRAIAPQPWLTVKPTFRKVQNGVSNGYDFGLFPVPDAFDLSVVLGATAFRPGFQTTISLVCRNSGTIPVADAVVSFELPPGTVDFLDALPAPGSITGNVIEWQLGTMDPGETQIIHVVVKTAVGTSLGTALHFAANIIPVADDLVPTNNFSTLAALVVGSYDPNDKQVVPAYVTPALLASGLPFEYTIRFQNTGTYPAEIVRIIDSLGAMVDPASFKFVAASHPCTWKIRGEGIVEFIFENINLPDSSSNEPASHGFVTFTVQPKRNLALGTVVQNFCDIYFDFNTPIRTNTAGTQVVYFIPGAGLAVQDALRLRPNPAAFFVMCEWKMPIPVDGRIRLFDVTGLPRLEMPVEAGQSFAHIEVGSLPPGLYFVVLEAGPVVLTNKLVVVSLVPLGWN